MKNKKDQRSDLLKIIGVVSMVVDHVGIIFFPGVLEFRAIGRLAFPIFASGIAQGYKHTSDLKAYVVRLLIFGLMAQVPASFVAGIYELNILFTFAYALIFLWLVDKNKYFFAALFMLPLLMHFVGLKALFSMDYGWYGVLLVFVFYFFKKKHVTLLAASFLSIVFAFDSHPINALLIFGVLTALYFPVDFLFVRLSKYFFYWFYPAHFLVLIIIHYAIYGTLP